MSISIILLPASIRILRTRILPLRPFFVSWSYFCLQLYIRSKALHVKYRNRIYMYTVVQCITLGRFQCPGVPAPWLMADIIVFKIRHMQTVRRTSWSSMPVLLIRLGLHCSFGTLDTNYLKNRLQLFVSVQCLDHLSLSRHNINSRVTPKVRRNRRGCVGPENHPCAPLRFSWWRTGRRWCLGYG